ncbi:MAG: hypothetical protein Fues2KO_02060 [Fuerstiella sp.]
MDANPVISETPPRSALENRATNTQMASDDQSTPIRAVSHTSAPLLTGNTIVAEVNGAPIFVDDLVGSIRVTIDADPQLNDDQRQMILHQEIKKRLEAYVEQEAVLQALRKKIPVEHQDKIRESLQEPFGQVLDNIRADNNVQTDQQLDQLLASQGMSVDLLRESFVRIQMVQGYLQSVTEISDIVDRIEMVQYYEQHPDEFTSEERVRWQEIVINFDLNGGQEAAEQKMATVVTELQAGRDFGELAQTYSDALSAEKNGDMGWLRRGTLADKEVEETLFSLKDGQTTRLFVQDDRIELFRVTRHERAEKSPFQEVQGQIEEKIKQQRRVAARQEAMEKLLSTAVITTIYDDEPEPVASPSLRGLF